MHNLVIVDVVPDRAKKLAQECKTHNWSSDFREAIERDDVDAVIVSTDERFHFEPAQRALELGKPTLVEKPLVLDLKEADTLLQTARERHADLLVGYTQRFRRKFSSAKELIMEGKIGVPISMSGRINVTRAVAEAVAKRAPGTSPTINTMTYLIDLALWYVQEKPMVVYAQANGDSLGRKRDSTWAIMTFRDGTFSALGVNWNIPDKHPALVASINIELVGTRGVISINDGHEDFLLVTNEPISSWYNPEVSVSVAYLGSAMPGDWSLSRFFGPMKYETELFIEHASIGTPVPLTTGKEARDNLELAMAMDLSLSKDEPVRLPLSV